jgi:hypothetical protein
MADAVDSARSHSAMAGRRESRRRDAVHPDLEPAAWADDDALLGSAPPGLGLKGREELSWRDEHEPRV